MRGFRYVFMLLAALVNLAHSLENHALHDASWNYSSLASAEQYDGLKFQDLPGFTRSIYRRNYAVITAESHVWAANPAWENTVTAHLISPVVGSNFAMYLANMKPHSTALPLSKTSIERFVFVLDGAVQISNLKNRGLLFLNGGGAGDVVATLHPDQFAYFPPSSDRLLTSKTGARVLVYERRSAVARGVFHHGSVSNQPVLPVPGEVFVLRKLLPQTAAYDFNIHVMDFLPGEHLNVKEVHYNQHGLMLLAGKGVYRLGDEWMPITKGDAIWMAPYCPQWYAALGPEPSRYILYKDTTIDPVYGV